MAKIQCMCSKKKWRDNLCFFCWQAIYNSKRAAWRKELGISEERVAAAPPTVHPVGSREQRELKPFAVNPHAQPIQPGPGTELGKLIAAMGIYPSEKCQCKAYMRQMNIWGVEGCRANRDQIVKWLQEGQGKWGWFEKIRATAKAVTAGLAFKLNPLDPFPGLVDEAIRRAEEAAKERAQAGLMRAIAGAAASPLEAAESIVTVLDPKTNKPLPPRKRKARIVVVEDDGRSEEIIWAYGVMTVLERRYTVLPKTLKSLATGGFDKPRLFIDGAVYDDMEWGSGTEYPLEETYRYPAILPYGNWLLGLMELYIRHPNAARYAMFQDDFVTYRNLRQYLEAIPYPASGYLNLYTFPSNQQLAGGRQGFYESNQYGRGAVALVFSRSAVLALLTNQEPGANDGPHTAVGHIMHRPMDPTRGHKAIDGGIVTAMAKAGFREYVHNPSLVQHIGEQSTVGNEPHLQATSFRGEQFDALELLKEASAKV